MSEKFIVITIFLISQSICLASQKRLNEEIFDTKKYREICCKDCNPEHFDDVDQSAKSQGSLYDRELDANVDQKAKDPMDFIVGANLEDINPKKFNSLNLGFGHNKSNLLPTQSLRSKDKKLFQKRTGRRHSPGFMPLVEKNIIKQSHRLKRQRFSRKIRTLEDSIEKLKISNYDIEPLFSQAESDMDTSQKNKN